MEYKRKYPRKKISDLIAEHRDMICAKQDAIVPQPHIEDADGTLAHLTAKINILLDQLEAHGFLDVC